MAINDTLFDLLNKWKTDVLTDNSSVGDTKDYVNQMYALLPMLVNQSLVLSDTVLKREDSWDNVNVNTLHYFEDLGVEGSPDSSMIKRQAGYLIYVKSSVSSLGLQVCITEDLHILYRLAPKGTWIMNANDSAITSLSERLASFETQVNQNGLDALNLRVEALRRQVGAVTGDKIKEVSDGLDELSKVISQKVDVYKSRQLLTDILNNNDVTIYDDGKQLLAPTIAVEGNDKVIAYSISSNNLPSEVKGYQVETSTDKSKWSINTETVDSGNLLSMINGTKYYVRALALPVDASDRTQSNYSDIVEVTVGTNKIAKTPEKPVPTQYPRTSKTVTPSDVFALASDLKSAVNTINKEKATTGYVDSGLNNLQSKITDIKTAITNALSDVKTQVDNSAVGTNLYTDTRDFDNLSIWTNGSHWHKTGEKFNGLAVMSTDDDWNGLGQTVQAKKGETYTYSVYARCKSGTGESTIYYTTTSGDHAQTNIAKTIVSLNETWQRVKGTVNITGDGALNARIEKTNDNPNTLLIAGLKLEKGPTATDYSLNPLEIATNDALSDVKAQVDNSAVGTNLLTGTSNTQDYTLSGSGWVRGSHSSNGNLSIPCTPGASYTYSVIIKSATFNYYVEISSFDSNHKWIANYQSYIGTDIGMQKVTMVAPENASFMTVHVSLNNPPDSQTVVFNSEKLELGSHATDWCPNPSEIATDGSVQAINDEIAKKVDKTELANYLKPWLGTQEEYDAISPHDPNTLYMIVAPTTTTTTTTTKAS